MSDAGANTQADAGPHDAWVKAALDFDVAAAKPEKKQARLPAKGERDELNLGLEDYWRTAATMFEMANRSVDEQMMRLADAIEQHLRKAKERDDDLREIGKRALPHFLADHRRDLEEVLAEVGRDLPSLERSASDVIRAARGFLDRLDSDPRVMACEKNPFEVPVRIFMIYQVVATSLMMVAQLAAA